MDLDTTQEQEDARFSSPETMGGGLSSPENTDALENVNTPVDPQENTEEVIQEDKVDAQKKENNSMRQLREAKERADRRAKKEQEKRMEVEEELALLKNKENNAKQEDKTDDDSEPDPEKYTDLAKYVKDLSLHQASKAAKETEARLEAKYKKEREQEKKQQQELEKNKKDKEWESKVKEARKRYDDYDDSISDAEDFEIKPHLEEEIRNSPHGADLLYHISKDLDLASELNSLSPREILRKLARIEMQIEDKRKGKPSTQVSKAPAPSTPLKTITGGGEKSIDQLVEDGDMEGIRAWQKKNPGKSW